MTTDSASERAASSSLATTGMAGLSVILVGSWLGVGLSAILGVAMLAWSLFSESRALGGLRSLAGTWAGLAAVLEVIRFWQSVGDSAGLHWFAPWPILLVIWLFAIMVGLSSDARVLRMYLRLVTGALGGIAVWESASLMNSVIWPAGFALVTVALLRWIDYLPVREGYTESLAPWSRERKLLDAAAAQLAVSDDE